MKFLARPNLPDAPVTLAAVGERYTQVIAALKRQGIACVCIGQSERLPPPVCDHADMRLHHAGGDVVFADHLQQETVRALTRHGFDVRTTAQPLLRRYPHDCALNALRLDNRLFCGPAPSPELRQYCLCNGITMRQIAQGYARCSCCVVSPFAIITADPSAAAACRKEGLEVLCIRPGHIRLDGYPYGFIGGCCGLIDRHTLAFTGVPERHPDGADIRLFLRRHNVKCICLTDDILTDIGGIIPLMIS